MKYTTPIRGVWAICLLAVSVLIAGPASAAQIDVPLQNLDGELEYNSNGMLTAPGISPAMGNIILRDLDFTIPNVSSTTFNSILAGSSPVRATFSLMGSTNGGPGATVTLSDTFTDLMSLGAFFTSSADENNVLQFASGDIDGGSFDGSVSNIFINATDRGFGESPGSGANQLTSGSANILATTDNAFGSNFDGQTFNFTGAGTLTLEQVAEPSYIGLLGLALLGMGLVMRRKERMPQA